MKREEKKELPFKKSFSEQNLFMLTCLSISCQLKMMSVTSYETGNCCRSLAKSNRCDSCKDITIASVEYLAPEAEPNVPINTINFLTVSIVVDSPSQQKKCLMLASLLGGICRTLC